MEADLVVVGSGAAGMTAAIVAAQAGLEVILIEKTPYFGGTTAVSGGGLWIPGNHHQSGTGDTRDDAERYLRALLQDLYDARKVGAFLRYGPEMVRYMEDHTDVAFMPGGWPDYEPGLDGAKVGRGLLPVSFDGTTLDELRRLRPPLPQLSLFGSMQFGLLDLPYFLNAGRSLRASSYVLGRTLEFAWHRLRYGRGARLANGNALAGRLLQSAIKAGVRLFTDTPARELIVKQGSVRGVVVAQGGKELMLDARRAVVLATGGFGANARLRAQHIPQTDAGWSLQPEGCEGDGIALGAAAGGVFKTDNRENCIWMPMSSMQRENGGRVVYPHTAFDRHTPGTLIVNKAGRRFINESTHYQSFGHTMHVLGLPSAFLIGDHAAQRKYGMGLARPAPYSVKPFVRAGYLAEAPTIRELAAKIGVDGAALEETVSRFNRHAADGEDPDFRRGADVYSAYMGDPLHKPNPCLAPLTHAPFYAVEIRPGDISTLCGLETNEYAQVLDAQDRVLDGLYAVGLDMNAVFRGAYPAGGASLGPAMTFGYVAARHIAA